MMAGGGGGSYPRHSAIPASSRSEPWGTPETLHLIDAYEVQLRSSSRGQLRASQWDGVAAAVNSRLGLHPSHPSAKTGTQCRHKLEKLRQRYRQELSTPLPSSWPIFPRMQQLELGSSPGASSDDADDAAIGWDAPYLKNRKPEFEADDDGENDDEDDAEEEEEGSDDEDWQGTGCELVDVVRGFGDRLLLLEKKRMEMMRELEKERMEMEARRAEMIVEASRCLAEAIAGAFSAVENKPKRHRHHIVLDDHSTQ